VLESIGVACITIAVILELASYYKQIAKTLRTKNSAQVSSSAFPTPESAPRSFANDDQDLGASLCLVLSR